jgi:hemolysin III
MQVFSEEQDLPQELRQLQSVRPEHEIMYLSDADEKANIATHTAGVFLSIGVGIALWLQSRGLPLGFRLSCIAFTVSMAMVYLFSTLSHAVHEPLKRIRMRAWDQGTIYLLIAGTYSPFIWEGSSGAGRTVLLLAVWSAALFGFYSKVFSAHRVNAVSTITYVMLGWLPAIPIVANTPTMCVVLMILGGVSYTLGIVFLIGSSWFTYAHAIWHLMVMLGSGLHTYAIFLLCAQ